MLSLSQPPMFLCLLQGFKEKNYQQWRRTELGLRELSPFKSMRADRLHLSMMRELINVLAKSFSVILNVMKIWGNTQ